MKYRRGCTCYAAGVISGIGLSIVALGGLARIEHVELVDLSPIERDELVGEVDETDKVRGWYQDTWWQKATNFGLWEGLRSDGSLIWQTYYEDGEQHGPSVRFDQHGKPMSLILYRHGQQIGGMDLEAHQNQSGGEKEIGNQIGEKNGVGSAP